MKQIIAILILVLAPVTLLPQGSIKNAWYELDIDTVIRQQYVRTSVRCVPLNTRLQIHWLDSVAVVIPCRDTMIAVSVSDTIIVGVYRDGVPALVKNTTYWHGRICDTIGWRMTACSLSVIEEGK